MKDIRSEGTLIHGCLLIAYLFYIHLHLKGPEGDYPMSTYILDCICGHPVTVEMTLTGDFRDVMRFQIPTSCPHCSAMKQTNHAPEEVGFPEYQPLCGNPYQIAWALQIRSREMARFRAFIDKYPTNTKETLQSIVDHFVKTIDDAGWWIENEQDAIRGLQRMCTDPVVIAIFDLLFFSEEYLRKDRKRHKRAAGFTYPS